MEVNFDNTVKGLYDKAYKIIDTFLKENRYYEEAKISVPEEFKIEFFSLVNKVNLGLMEDKDNFYGYFLFQMSREIRFDISSPTAVNFKGAKYVIYFNPIIFLTLNIEQMESTIKHEILHILSMHLIRAREFKGRFSKIAINMAMDVVVNKYLNDLPPYATTLEWVNLNYSLKLKPFEPFEYYVEKLQIAIALLEEDKDAAEDDSDFEQSNKDDNIETEYSPEKTHDLWEGSSDIDEKTLNEFTEKFVSNSEKGTIPAYLEGMIAALKNSNGEIPWNLYLHRLMGTIESNKKKTITRRNRRQPNRLDLRGELRSHKPQIAVALDISGSISDEEFKQATKEVLSIVKNYNHEITIIECDAEIRRSYKVKSIKDIKERSNISGGTRYSPVFEYANNNKVNLLVYFTDGKGEDELQVKPKGYSVLWVISGRGEKLSLKEPFGAVKKLSNIEIKDDTPDLKDVIRDGFSMNNQERI
ncbi:VWA-like domain-containing protein [Candidatus Clostridium radicumherbarum]|uniref:VWA-like domain-containing protein n=1 Tax=Candidatus Clostridium radicumherbarum TaxID=3381662 RepID=A0ABW8TM91_9CLOT